MLDPPFISFDSILCSLKHSQASLKHIKTELVATQTSGTTLYWIDSNFVREKVRWGIAVSVLETASNSVLKVVRRVVSESEQASCSSIKSETSKLELVE